MGCDLVCTPQRSLSSWVKQSQEMRRKRASIHLCSNHNDMKLKKVPRWVPEDH